ncbi:hypothetical protein [Acanthopleuribacter pedis]|uniref:Uncharacterized protein n=1 Tax=Acanthopleuribacter pedis TaxID=442870 RepID=A0A8J7QAC4_9BACT|nr:hypothetical protein [Acanthopleuribacter pedis]MBO1321736.1 hypothetical protein [Acanthopleuribacter pedis]
MTDQDPERIHPHLDGKTRHAKEVQLEKLEAKIQEMEQKLTQNKAQAALARETLQHDSIDHLEQHLSAARLDFAKLADVAEEAWDQFEDAAEALWHRIQERLNKH